tara:strand:+ start:390 stop:1283 length:894 start_codon:yes stop_codon:yes gene_type:complete
MKKNKKILITGVCGVFGSTLAVFLQDQGYFVEGLDIPTSSPPIDLGNIRVHETNMLDVDALGILIKDFDCIIHLAAISRVKHAKKNPLNAITANIMTTASLLEVIRISDRKPSMIFASSIEVNVDEKGAYKPTNLYGITKSFGELLAQRYCADYGLKVAVARIPGIYGALYDYPDKVPNILIKNCLEGLTVKIPKQSKKMPYVHLKDMCRIMVEAIEQILTFKENSYSVFEIKPNNNIDLKELVNEILIATGEKSSIEYFDNREDLSFNLSSIKYKEPEIELKEGISLLVESFLSSG